MPKSTQKYQKHQKVPSVPKGAEITKQQLKCPKLAKTTWTTKVSKYPWYQRVPSRYAKLPNGTLKYQKVTKYPKVPKTSKSA